MPPLTNQLENRLFLRVRDSRANVERALKELNVAATTVSDNQGTLKGTVKVYIDEGADVPRFTKHLKKTYRYRNSAWEVSTKPRS